MFDNAGELLFQVAKDILYQRFKLGDADFDSFPDYFGVNAEIEVYQFVPHTCHIRPGNIRVFSSD